MIFHRLLTAAILSSSVTAFTPNVVRRTAFAAVSPSSSMMLQMSSPELTEEERATATPAPELTAEEIASSQSKRKVERVRHTMFVGNLPFDTTESQIQELFETYGKVSLVSIPRNREDQRPRGFAFVDMGSEDELSAAIAGVDGTSLGGREIRVNKSVPKGEVPARRESSSPSSANNNTPEGFSKIYMGNIPFTCTEEEISEFFGEYGEVKEVFVPVNRDTGAGRGFAFVTMKEEDCKSAIESTNGVEFGGRTLVVNEPLPPGKKAPARRAKGTKMYVGNLSFYTVSETLEDIFGEFGEIIDCYLPEDPESGGSRGFGFVTMEKDAAMRAIEEIDGCEVDGRVIRVNEAQPKGRKPPPPQMDAEESDVIAGSWSDMDQ